MNGNCTRCTKDEREVFFIPKNPSVSFADFGIGELPAPPSPEYSCLECLTNLEIAKFLVPVALFVVETNLRERLHATPRNEDAFRSFAYVETWLRFQRGYEQGTDDRGKAIKALLGLIR